MESHISPADIQQRAEALASTQETPVEKPEDTKPEEKPAANAPEVKPEVKAEVKPESSQKPADNASKPADKAQDKPVEKSVEKKQPNDPAELRKWSTKLSQENAALRDEMKSLKSAIEKLSKKPIDYKELGKDPEAIKRQIEIEREEAVKELQEKFDAAQIESIKNSTIIEKMKRESDTENFPEWKRLFPLIQNLSANQDGRINFNRHPGEVLDDLYNLALELSPVQVPKEQPKEEVKEEPKVEQQAPQGKSPEAIEAEIQARVAEAEKRAFEKAQEQFRNEQAGQGIGSVGKGGKRNNAINRDALMNMPREELKKLISQE